MDPFTLAYLVGHTDISITKRYVHPEDETVKAAMERVAAEHGTPHKIPHKAIEADTAAIITAAAIN
jgi:hypothetical protein